MFPLTTLANACPPKVQFKMENPIIFTKLKCDPVISFEHNIQQVYGESRILARYPKAYRDIIIFLA